MATLNGRPRHGSTCSITADLSPQKADLPINIIVIGACIAGLACAYTLRQAGHNVLVVEAADDLRQSPSGIRSPPNMSRILFKWGLGPEIVKQTSGRCPKLVFHSAYTGEVMGELLYHEKVMEALEGEVYLLHHSDLLRLLYNLAREAGAKFSFGSRVVDVDSNSPSITLASGKKLHADLIVGADGHRSIVRSALDPVPTDGEQINYTSYQFTVPVSAFKNDNEFLRLVEEPTWNLWMGAGWATLGFGVRNNTEFAVSFIRDEKDAGVEFDWRRRSPVRDLDIMKLDCAPILKRMLRETNHVARIKGDGSTTLESWSDSEGHIVVLGEAAHGWNPGSSHTAALGIEDAVVLGRLLSHLKSKDEVGRFLSAFQEIRQPRSEWVCMSEHQKVDFVALRPGPLRDARDQSMRSQMEEGQKDWTSSEDSYLRRSWEEFRDAFGYDAYDDADTWWVEWGVLLERMNVPDGTSSGDVFNGQIIVEQALHIS